MGVSCRSATTTPTRKVMIRKRTRPNQDRASLTLGVDSIANCRLIPIPRVDTCPAALALRPATPAAGGRSEESDHPLTGRQGRRGKCLPIHQVPRHFRSAGRAAAAPDPVPPAASREKVYVCPASWPISENSGKYIEMTMPPTTIPRNTIMTGSSAVSRSFTAASTSSS
jgi:hypothetical protein